MFPRIVRWTKVDVTRKSYFSGFRRGPEFSDLETVFLGRGRGTEPDAVAEFQPGRQCFCLELVAGKLVSRCHGRVCEKFYEDCFELRTFALYRAEVLQFRSSHRCAMPLQLLVGKTIFVANEREKGIVEKKPNQQQWNTHTHHIVQASWLVVIRHAGSFFHISLTGSRGQEDASALVFDRGEEKGTGARGAPVPEVGLGVKIKRVEFRSPGSLANEGHMNSR
jgi:hypothetical protein